MTIYGFAPKGEYEYTKELEDIILREGIKEVIPKGKIIFYPDDIVENLYFLQNGNVLLGLWGKGGEEKIIEILGEKNFFGTASVIASMPDRIFATAKTEVTVYKFSRKKCFELVDSSPIFRKVLINYIAAVIIKMSTSLEDISFNDAKDRVYNLLWTTSNQDDAIDGDWYGIKYKYTQTEIGNIIGATRSTVSRLIGELCNEGYLRIVNNTMQISIKIR
jgi:CRP/FNR family cyclic AMP-dependent transcriptional regulator